MSKYGKVLTKLEDSMLERMVYNKNILDSSWEISRRISQKDRIFLCIVSLRMN
jgi:hypothetical protein